MKVTRRQLWTYLTNQEDTYEEFLDCCDGETNGVSRELVDELASFLQDEIRKPIRLIIADQNMSENHPGGDDIVGAVEDALAAIKDGYRIVTWYGPETESLVAGCKPNYVTVEG
jgi:hypothetical protein